tara:strand:+ start:564 stop:1538 length:975 start_codon:yes stop_codon:yes gene_type:complete
MILKIKNLLAVFFLTAVFLLNTTNLVKAEEESSEIISNEIKQLRDDLKTLEKAIYKKSDISPSTNSSSNKLNEDILTRHLLKLNEIESQFQDLTNKFEEINFKMDKLSKRITKMQSDNQLRFSDLESADSSKLTNQASVAKKKKLPGTDLPQDLGRISDSDLKQTNEVQKTQSVESAGLVVTEKTSPSKSLLPNKPPKEQYDFAVSFIKVGDYETAEYALREFIDKNKSNTLAGSAQYWYGETFRVRQLYQDAAAAYLDGYQNYPKSKKAPINLLKLGSTLVQLGEKEQGCLMIQGVKKQYPKASKSVLQKAEYENKKFKCNKT